MSNTPIRPPRPVSAFEAKEGPPSVAESVCLLAAALMRLIKPEVVGEAGPPEAPIPLSGADIASAVRKALASPEGRQMLADLVGPAVIDTAKERVGRFAYASKMLDRERAERLETDRAEEEHRP